MSNIQLESISYKQFSYKITYGLNSPAQYIHIHSIRQCN